MKTIIAFVLLLPLSAASFCAAVGNDDGWRELTHGGLRFAIPADWDVLKERKHEGRWGVRDEASRQAFGFSIVRERRPERSLEHASKDGMKVESLGTVELGGVSGEQHELSGELDGDPVVMRVTIIEGLLPDGDRISFNTAAANHDRADVLPVIERVMGSVRATGELVDTLTGYGRHELFDGLIALETRNNWDMSGHGDRVSWEPPLFSLYGASLVRFGQGYTLTGRNGLLSKLEEPTVVRGDIFGLPGWEITGTGLGVAYADAMRTNAVPVLTRVRISDVCIGAGDRFGYAVTATDEQLAEHEAELQRLLDSVEVNLPASAAPCDQPIAYEWSKGLHIEVPRSWRKNQDSPFHLSWYDRVLWSGANIALYISHGAAAKHPLIGEGYAPVETLGTRLVDGYPATHYRKRVTGTDKIETTYDYYVLDTRMRYERDGRAGDATYLYFQFSTSPSGAADPDLEMYRRVLSSVRFADGWVSETPVAREEPAAPVGAETGDDGRVAYEQARRLREEGARLQRQGNLAEAVAKFRQSLALYPDDRLEAHVKRVEQAMGDR
jgi:hypothetical protein